MIITVAFLLGFWLAIVSMVLLGIAESGDIEGR
jgi:hypothetical protein